MSSRELRDAAAADFMVSDYDAVLKGCLLRALKLCCEDHGPITPEMFSSLSKRLKGELKARRNEAIEKAVAQMKPDRSFPCVSCKSPIEHYPCASCGLSPSISR